MVVEGIFIVKALIPFLGLKSYIERDDGIASSGISSSIIVQIVTSDARKWEPVGDLKFVLGCSSGRELCTSKSTTSLLLSPLLNHGMMGFAAV